MVNNAYVPIDFYVLDVEYNASCPITLGRPFLRTVSAIIDMKEGTIKYHFPFKKGIEHFPMRRDKFIFSPPLKARFDVNSSSFENTCFFLLFVPNLKALKKSTCWEITQEFPWVLEVITSIIISTYPFCFLFVPIMASNERDVRFGELLSRNKFCPPPKKIFMRLCNFDWAQNLRINTQVC